MRYGEHLLSTIRGVLACKAGVGERFSASQSLRLTPKASSFLAYASRRFAAFAAASTAAWMAFGPFLAAALINPDL